MNAAERDLVKRVLRVNGIEGSVQIARERGSDELVIVLPSVQAAGLDEERITQELQDALHRKVWIVTDADTWTGETEDL
jgi:RNase P protein component